MDKFLREGVSQPKSDIADYVERNGVLVPRRFHSLSDGLESGVDLIIRTEHPDEYNGPSGLFDSYVINSASKERAKTHVDSERRRPTKRELHDAALKKRLSEGGSDTQFYQDLRESEASTIQKYCGHARLAPEEVSANLRYSIWELVSGMNHTVIADSTIPYRYHVFSFGGFKREAQQKGYVCLDDNNVSLDFGLNLSASDIPLSQLIATYEKARRLDSFDPNHCPAIEMQSNTDGVHFLQYHRTRDFQAADFSLNEERAGWAEAFFVRGSTPSAGKVVDMTLYHNYKEPLDENEKGSFGYTYDETMEEVGLRRRWLQFISNPKKSGLHLFFLSSCEGHSSKSALFKPEVSIIAPMKALNIPEDYKSPNNTNLRRVIPIEVISDGQRAFVRFAG